MRYEITGMDKKGQATGIQGLIQPDHAPGTSKQVGL
jgi:hypothetical protein